jgi:hypothetical protein
MAPPSLTYASGKAQITRDGGGLVIDFPRSETTADFWIRSVALLGISLSCLVVAVWPSGVTRIGTAIVTHPGGVMPRVICFAIAAGMVISFRADLRTRHLHASLTLHGMKLKYSTPGTWGMNTREYDLSEYVDVEVERDEAAESPDIYLALKGRDGKPDAGLVMRPDSRAERVHLQLIADALRQVAWPRRAAERPPRSTFTRVDRDTIESDRGFAVRMPEVGVVEYREGHDTLTLRVDRAWSSEHQMCFVLRRETLRKWDAPPDVAPEGAELSAERQREIEYNLTEALAELGVRCLINAGTDAAATLHTNPTVSLPLTPLPTQRTAPHSPS